MFVPLIALVLWLSRSMRFAGNWILYTTAILLFSFGMLIQYRLYSDPEYNARNKSEAREEKMEALRLRYIMENYDPLKKQMMGLPPTPAQPISLEQIATQAVELFTLECADIELHLDTCLLLFCVCACLCFLCTRRLSSLATKKQFHHSAAYSCATSRSCRYIKRR